MTKIVCDMCGESVGFNRYNVLFEADYKWSYNAPHQIARDICIDCSKKILNYIETYKENTKRGDKYKDQET